MKKRFYYTIRGYRWAPESFRVSKGFTKDSCIAVSLTPAENQEVGILFLAKGYDAAIGYVKYLERARARSLIEFITYGFHAKESPRQIIYCPDLYHYSDAAISERLRIYKQIRNGLKETDGRVVISVTFRLDGQFRPENTVENSVTADFSRPLRISLGKTLIPWKGSTHEYRPYQKMD